MKYPYITIDQRKPVLIYKDRRGIYMVDKNDTLSELDITYVKHQKNQTAKVLANTYGEVKSKAHAEFIVKLTEVAKGKNITVINLNEAKSFVFDSEGCLKFYKSNVNDILAGNLKQITIPLPPECEGLSIGGGGQSGAEFTDTKDDAKQTDSGWPKVGDEVVLTLEPSINHKVNCIVRFIGSKHIILTDKKGREYSRKKAKAIIQKPKTPEQELRDEIIDDLGKIIQRGTISIVEFLSKYNVTKKPQ